MLNLLPPEVAAGLKLRGATRPAEWRARVAVRTALAILAFATLAALGGYRILQNLNVPGEPHLDRFGLRDFRDAIYYPVVSLLEGNNPYDPVSYAKTYPVDSTFALYLPSTLIVHLPFGLLPFRIAELLYTVMTVALVPVLARLAMQLSGTAMRIDRVFALAALILLSRPGQMNLFVGQSALTLAIGSYLALNYPRDRPWLAGLGLAISTFKPTFGLPLGVLMLLRRDWRAAAIGLSLSAAISVGIGVLLTARAGGLLPMLYLLRRNEQVFTAQGPVGAFSSLIRVDAVAFVSRLAGRPLGTVTEMAIMVGVLAFGGFAVWRLGAAEDAPARRLSAALTCVTVIACTYHQIYCLLLLTFPVVTLVAGRWAPRAVSSSSLRRALLVLLLIPSFNYLASFPALHAFAIPPPLSVALASLNAGALLVALGLYARVALMAAASGTGSEESPMSAGPSTGHAT